MITFKTTFKKGDTVKFTDTAIKTAKERGNCFGISENAVVNNILYKVLSVGFDRDEGYKIFIKPLNNKYKYGPYVVYTSQNYIKKAITRKVILP